MLANTSLNILGRIDFLQHLSRPKIPPPPLEDYDWATTCLYSVTDDGEGGLKYAKVNAETVVANSDILPPPSPDTITNTIG